MAGKVEARLKELGIELPDAMEPKIAKILTAKIGGDFLFVSGQITQWNGELRYVGKVGRDFDLAAGQAAARLSALNVLAQAKKALGGDLVFRLIHSHPAFTKARVFLARRCLARIDLAATVHLKGFGF